MVISLFLRQLYYRVIKPVGVVRLPTGFFVRVRKLALYELDAVEYSDPGQFTYPYLINGKTIERAYDLSQWKEPPKAPDIPEKMCQEGSYEWAMWRVVATYEAALTQRIKQVEATEDYSHSVARYILAHCLSDADRPLVSNPACYETVFAAAINPEVSIGDIEAALASTFHASFDDEPILDQVLSDKDGSGKADALRMWAGQARAAWGLDKVKWAALSLKERAEMVVTVKLGDWLSALEWRKKEREK